MSKTRYHNMTGGCTLFEAGRKLGTLFPEDTQAAIRATRREAK